MTDPQCASCENHVCRTGVACHNVDRASRWLTEADGALRLHRAASTIEARYYNQLPRLAETIRFAQELGVQKLGLAFCIGLASEAKVAGELLSSHFSLCSVCCKVGGIQKTDMGLDRIHPDRDSEVMCHPAAQAQLLNEAGTELNVAMGLCVGHDALFAQASNAPVTTLIAKDRVLAHNPIGAIYCDYVRRRLPNPST